jgi:hypothetical protein
MTLKELQYNILNIARGGVSSDDEKISSRQVKFWINYHRALAVAEDYKKGASIHPQLVQDLGCVQLTEADKGECASASWGEKIMKATIPKLVELPNNRGLAFVGLIDKQTPIAPSSSGTVHFAQYKRVGADLRRYYTIGDSLYIATSDPKDNLTYVNVRGIFEDPSSISVCSSTGTCVCFDESTDKYPIPAKYVPLITERILKGELGYVLQTPNDEDNDANL